MACRDYDTLHVSNYGSCEERALPRFFFHSKDGLMTAICDVYPDVHRPYYYS